MDDLDKIIRKIRGGELEAGELHKDEGIGDVSLVEGMSFRINEYCCKGSCEMFCQDFEQGDSK